MKIMIDIDEDVFTRLFDNGTEINNDDLFAMARSIRNGTPNSKIGHWIDMSEGFSPFGCSECRAVEFKKSNYCPTCGTKMVKSEYFDVDKVKEFLARDDLVNLIVDHTCEKDRK